VSGFAEIVVVISGAASGIGAAASPGFASAGARVIAVEFYASQRQEHQEAPRARGCDVRFHRASVAEHARFVPRSM